MNLIYFTTRAKFEIDDNIDSRSKIIAFWHGDLLMQPFLYKKVRGDRAISAIISEHRDGKLISSIVKLFGIGTIAGSSSKGGVKSLVSAIKTIKNNIDVAITPDGPRGPYRSIADGIVMIAQKCGVEIVVFETKPSRYWAFNSWDRFIVPKPFCTITYRAKKPFNVNDMTKEDALQLIKERMDRDVL